MNVKFEWVKPIPKEQINQFEDRVVYNTAVYTREYTKGSGVYPYLSGELSRSESASPIVGSHKEYGLTAGVDYALYVWNMKNVNWTNSSTQPQWYYTQFKNNAETIVNQAISSALKEI